MNRVLFLVGMVLLFSHCSENSGSNTSSTKAIPNACDLQTIEQYMEILLEPVRKGVPTNAGVGELSACTFALPGRDWDANLELYVLSPPAIRDQAALSQIADQWKERYGGVNYEILPNSKYLMAWFPGEYKTYPSTLVVLPAVGPTLVITGVEQEFCRTIAFQIMGQYKWL
ncbi:MAG TPA: hypothetical protein PKA00_07045 [Saprospiraceae bacterium]|nr:hypothetical protein [Saprospiraceae bacterium]HMQ82645.1 hypothetical protein [Saprospiraceae bacterium]